MEFKKIGGAWFPNETVEIRAHCVVAEPFYERNSKKYLNIGLHENTIKLVEKIHQDSNKYLKTTHVVPVLFDNILKVKVPWRYNREPGLPLLQDQNPIKELMLEHCSHLTSSLITQRLYLVKLNCCLFFSEQRH